VLKFSVLRKRPAKKGVSEKTRAEDERLREMLRNADMKVLDRAIEKAIAPVPAAMSREAVRRAARATSKPARRSTP